jgi:hypothetical protein
MSTRSLKPFPFSRFPVLGASALAALLSLSAAGCASSSATAVPAKVAPAASTDSGFLTDYSRLVASDQSPAVRFYRDDSRKGGYRRLYVRPVAVWRGAGGAAGEIPEEDLQFVADAFYRALDRHLGQNFELVREAGPGVLEIDIGFTLVPNPDGDIDHFKTTVPVEDLAPRSGELPDATRRFVQDCLLEVEFRDIPAAAAKPTAGAPGAPSKKPKKAVRAAFVDARRGADSPKGTVKTWADLDAVFEKWATALDERLVHLRDGDFRPRLTAGGAAKKK